MKLLLNGSFGSSFSTLWVYRRKILKIYRRLREESLFLWLILVVFLDFIVFSFTFGHKIPYPKGYILGNFKLWLLSKNHLGGPRKSNVAMVTKFPTLQQLHLGENGFLIGFSLGMMPNVCCRFFSFLRFHMLLKKP